jgi:hypothetical protein
MKQFFIIIFVLQVAISAGQSPIEGVYASKELEASIRFTKDFHYFYETTYCTGKTIDSGTYSFHGDTINFQSFLSKTDILNNFFISENTWVHKQNSSIDTLYFSIQNYTQMGLSYVIDLKLNDSLLLHLDSLKYYERKYYKFPLFQNSDNGVLYVYANGVKKAIPLDNEVDIQLRENLNSIAPLKDKYICVKDKMYSLNGFRIFKKKYYLYRQ